MPDLSAQIVACIPSLRRYARGLTGNRDEADDLVQDTLERAWARIGFWRRRSELRAWLFSILHNRFVDQVRCARRSLLESVERTVSEEVRPSQSDMLEVRDLDQALLKLAPEQREVLLLVAVEQLGYEQVAGVLEVPVGTVMSRLSRARERLRAILDGRPAASKLKAVK